MREALILGTASAAAALLLGSLDRLTGPRIEAARAQQRQAMLTTLSGAKGPFEKIAEGPGMTRLEASDLPGREVVLLHANGYGGEMEIAVLRERAGRILALDVVRHRETPGLGDFIERRRSDWSDQFLGGRRQRVDMKTGATITSRAYAGAIERMWATDD